MKTVECLRVSQHKPKHHSDLHYGRSVCLGIGKVLTVLREFPPNLIIRVAAYLDLSKCLPAPRRTEVHWPMVYLRQPVVTARAGVLGEEAGLAGRVYPSTYRSNRGHSLCTLERPPYHLSSKTPNAPPFDSVCSAVRGPSGGKCEKPSRAH